MFCFLEDLYEEAGGETIIFAFLKDSGKKKEEYYKAFLSYYRDCYSFQFPFCRSTRRRHKAA